MKLKLGLSDAELEKVDSECKDARLMKYKDQRVNELWETWFYQFNRVQTLKNLNYDTLDFWQNNC